MLTHAAKLFAVGSTLFVFATHADAACTAMMDTGTSKMLVQDGACDQRATAASTFKIAISLMGYDAGFLKDEHTPALPFHEGYPDWIPSWRTTTDPTTWIKNSVVWYSQQVTKWLGEDRFRRYVTAFHYGNEDVSGDPGKHNGLSRAWLSSSLQISPLEQLRFLQAVVQRKLPVSAHAYEMTDHLTVITALSDGWVVHGKTGMAFPRKADGAQDPDHAFGWFVGWATKDGRAIAFARLIQDDKREPVSAGLRARDTLMKELPSLLDRS